MIWTSVPIAVRIATPISYVTSPNTELFWEGSHCFKLVSDFRSRFKSQIAIAFKSRDLEHLASQNSLRLLRPQSVSHFFAVLVLSAAAHCRWRPCDNCRFLVGLASLHKSTDQHWCHMKHQLSSTQALCRWMEWIIWLAEGLLETFPRTRCFSALLEDPDLLPY